jgi:hypothetical protein
VVYVPSGGTAKLIWDYHVNDKIKDFGDDGSSPVWYFEIPRIMIAVENGLHGWKWTIVTSTCPPRLLNPTRVSKESTATLVITNVSTADNGIYGCALVLKGGSQINSPIGLVVGGVFNSYSRYVKCSNKSNHCNYAVTFASQIMCDSLTTNKALK